MSTFLDEATLEQIVLDTFGRLGYQTAHGPDIGPNGSTPERHNYAEVILHGRLRAALQRINAHLPADAIDAVVTRLSAGEGDSLLEENRRCHRLLTDGIDVEFVGADGRIAHDKAWLFDFDHPDNNDWLVVNQFTVVDQATGKPQIDRRPDVVVFVNGLPLAVIELKNPADAQATVRKAFHQLETYKKQTPDLFTWNELLVISDGLEARLGTISSDWDRFSPWRTTDGTAVAPLTQPQIDVLLRGVFDRSRLLDLIRGFVVFDDGPFALIKKLAGYHQYHAVRKAVGKTVEAVGRPKDHRIGVVWHTQGSGKSLSMVFYAGRLIAHPALCNATIVMLTDRNDLDNQLYGTFCACQDLLRQEPVQATDRAELRKLLSVASGGVIFTTVQKFMPDQRGDQHPQLTDRRNVVVIADEAHRSQYDFIDGFAAHLRAALPNAAFVGFTGTPIETGDKNTIQVFGDCIDVYDVQQAVEDGATVPIYYEGRLAKIELPADERPRLDEDFEEVTEGEEEAARRKLKTKWAALEALVGAGKRVKLIAQDILNHFEKRRAALPGKAMIVCMSRRICVELYREIVALRPAWDEATDDRGAIKVIMTGSAADDEAYQPHIRSKSRQDQIAKRLKDPADPLALLIVCDMWLTGFDVPCAHTMYLDKPLKAHGLMQAIARVNRVFGAKPNGLVVDYLGLAAQLKEAMATYTAGGGRGKPTYDQKEAVALLQEKLHVVRGMFHGFDHEKHLMETPAERLAGVKQAADFLLQKDPKDGKTRYLKAANDLYSAFALAAPADEALAVGAEVGFFQAVRACFVKALPPGSRPSAADLDAMIQQLVSRALVSDEVIDIFKVAGLEKPDISILSEEFLAEIRGMPQRSLAAELLERLLRDEIRESTRRNLVQSRQFSEMLDESIRKYQNRSIEAAQVITEMLELAKQLRESSRRGSELGLSEEEVAFYDALGANDSAVQVMGTPVLCAIARELVTSIRASVTIDWEQKETVRAEIRTRVKRLLRRYKYPPDKEEQAVVTVLKQAELLCKDWALA